MKSKKELLVIIACIAFLFANIAAVGPAGRSRAKEAACLSNMIKWGQILQIYTAANNGYFHSRTIGTVEGQRQMWQYTYEPYYGNFYGDKMMLYCPAADNQTSYFTDWGGNWVAIHGSYGFNRYIVDMQGAYETDPHYWRHVEVEGADNIPILVDCLYPTLFWNDDDPPPEYDGDAFSVGQGIGLAATNRHNNGHVNVCFMDFSARKVGLKELWTLKGNRLFDTCGTWTICGFGGDAEACAAAWDAAAPWMSEFPEY